MTVVGFILSYSVLRFLRIRHKNPRYIPTQFLKRRWQNWTPKHSYAVVDSSNQALSEASSADGRRGTTGGRETTNASAAVDRNTSIRSVMTLPPYKPAPGEHERVLGREGERGGIDMVVEFPETTEEQEERRDAQMESLYQIRVARRQENAEREDRRRRRREARERGDTATLELLRRERAERDRANSGANGPSDSVSSLAANVLAENEARERERRISSVSYADVGLARHDGTRIRASSESEHPLLESAATPGMGDLPSPGFLRHARGRSGSSALSMATTASDLSQSPHRTRPTSTTETINLGHTRTQSREIDLADQSIHAPDPPQYDNLGWEGVEEAPPYTSPTTSTRAPALPQISTNGAPQLPVLSSLPAIEITTHTPGHSSPATPVTSESSSGGATRPTGSSSSG